MFPTTRPRRLRRTPALRDLVRETWLRPSDFVYPLFVRHGKGVKAEIASMPGQYHFSPDTLVDEAGAALEDGVRAVLLFGIPDRKDERGSEAWDDGAAVQTGVRDLKSAYPDLLVVTDVCLCEYTSHGHCGLVARAGGIRWSTPFAGHRHVQGDGRCELQDRRGRIRRRERECFVEPGTANFAG